MPRGFLSEGSGRRESDDDGNATVDLELGWSTDKAWGFKDPFRKDKRSSGGSREKLIWIPRAVKGKPLEWDDNGNQTGRLTAPRWLLEKSGLL